MRYFTFVLFTFVLGCSENVNPADLDRRLTKAECTEGVDHVIQMFGREPAMVDAAKSMRDGRDGFIAQCTNTATVRDHECLMKSKTSHELGLCPMPGTR